MQNEILNISLRRTRIFGQIATLKRNFEYIILNSILIPNTLPSVTKSKIENMLTILDMSNFHIFYYLKLKNDEHNLEKYESGHIKDDLFGFPFRFQFHCSNFLSLTHHVQKYEIESPHELYFLYKALILHLFQKYIKCTHTLLKLFKK
jgi:hypothetical protein